MKINLQVKEAHFSITDDNNEVGLVYSLKDVDMEADALVLIRAFKGVMTQLTKLADDEEPDYAAARGFTTHKSMPKKAPTFADNFEEVQ